MKSLLAATLLTASLAVTAADESYKVDGVIGSIYVSQDGQDFRVALENAPTLCGNSWTTAYLDAKEPNYDTFVKVLLAAKTGKLPVTLVTRKTDQGYCKLFFVILK